MRDEIVATAGAGALILLITSLGYAGLVGIAEPDPQGEPAPLRILEAAPGGLRTIAVCPAYEIQVIRDCIGSALNSEGRVALHIVEPATAEHHAGEFTPDCAAQPGGCPQAPLQE